MLIKTLPAAEYHAHPAISKSGLDLIHKAPALYQWRKQNPEPPTPDMRFGSLYHLAVLEPDRFAAEVAIEPEDAPKRPSITQLNAAKPSQKTVDAIDYWESWDNANASKEVIGFDESILIRDMKAALMKNKAAHRLLTAKYDSECSLFWIDSRTGLDCRARLDAVLSGPIIVDLKTCQSASSRDFQRKIYDRRYHVQAAFYSDGIRKSEGVRPTAFAFIAQEKTAPYLSAVHIASDAMLSVGRKEYEADLDTYARCLATNTWPGLSDKAELIDLPTWAMKEHEGQ